MVFPQLLFSCLLLLPYLPFRLNYVFKTALGSNTS